MKKIVLALDSFKGCISSAALAHQITQFCNKKYPNVEFEPIPISDGGEGLTEAIAQTKNTEEMHLTVRDPLMRNIEACYLTADNGKTAVLEMASAAGLPLVSPDERNPLLTTTYGVGEMIADALERGCRHFLMGIGGSATNDAGIGMLQALGFRITDSKGDELPGIGASLEKIASIDNRNVHRLLREATFEIACDVNNPLYGKNGAAYVFAPQKGADAETVERLDKGLRHFAEIIHAFSGYRVDTVPGAGAAGGLGGCLMALFNAKLYPGIELILNYTGFDRHIENASLVITGEGRMDKQTLMGKAPFGVMTKSRQKEIPVIAIAGRIEDRNELLSAGFNDLFEISPRNIPLSDAMKKDVFIKNLQRTLSTPNFTRYLQAPA